MKRHLLLFAMLESAAFFLTAMPGHAGSGQLSPERLDLFDRRGYFTPAFKAAVHELVEMRQAITQTTQEQKKLQDDLPSLQKKSADAEAKVGSLEQELAQYQHLEEKDYISIIQPGMNDPKAKPEEQLMLAQAYIWAYPNSPHQTEVQQYLLQMQKKVADQKQAEKDAEAAREAAHAKLLQRVQAKDLSLDEWKDFLRDMSQQDVLKYLGRPASYGTDYWIYTGVWTTDPMTGQKVGLRIDFNGTRVLAVVVQVSQ
jgi:hypothetical protein